MSKLSLQNKRLISKIGFFTLFVIAPPLDIFRFDLYRNNLVLFGQDWIIGFTAFQYGLGDDSQVITNLLLKGFLPVLGVGALLIFVAWRWGRLYCGWLCPHFSVVESINGLMRRASGKPSLWEKAPLPELQPDGHLEKPNRWYWIPTILAIVGFAFLWAVSFLTYLLPPDVIYYNLLHGQLTPNQFRFIAITTLVLTVEFAFARHLFCRFGCAVGLFQSLAWMANDRAMVIGFNRTQAKDCKECNNACDNVCPMRLKPRTLKRKMFTCTQCGECIEACEQVEHRRGKAGLIQWVEKDCAIPVITGRDHDKACF